MPTTAILARALDNLRAYPSNRVHVSVLIGAGELDVLLSAIGDWNNMTMYCDNDKRLSSAANESNCSLRSSWLNLYKTENKFGKI